MAKIKIGIIGGTGLENPSILQDVEVKEPSDKLKCGSINDVPVVILSRHGQHHESNPTEVNYRANIWALKEAGVTHILATNACGSLQERFRPGELVFIDQFIDRTTKRETTFYNNVPGGPKGVLHMPMAHPFCPRLRKIMIGIAEAEKYAHHSKGTIVCIEGPRFSTRAESFLFRAWGADLIGMTTVPEVPLAMEVGIPYATICLSTDYDCWHEEHESVSVEMVKKTFADNVHKATCILLKAVEKIGAEDWTEELAKRQKTIKESIQSTH